VNVRRRTRDVDLTVISGLSGAGRSEAAKALEDLGWFVIDNLPPALIRKMLELALGPGSQIKRIALVIDVRGGTFFREAITELDKLRRNVGSFRLIFLDASEEVLRRRFELNRRRHPLAPTERIVDGIRRERELLGQLRDGSDLIIDTTELSVRGLRARIGAYFEGVVTTEGLKTTIMSFGYKYGLPLDSDLVLDVRFLPNPHWVDELRPLTGLNESVQRYVLDNDAATEFMDRTRDLLAIMLPGFQTEGRHYLTIAVGCTGGRHRSVVLAQAIAALIEEKGFHARVIHRDVERASVAE
jgi:UPF0042 nucleotide-binding protein